MYCQHAVHVPEVNANSAEWRVYMALKRRARAERNNGRVIAGANTHNLLHVLCRLRKDNRIWRFCGDPRCGVAMLFAYRARSDKPVAERRLQLCDRLLDSLVVG